MQPLNSKETKALRAEILNAYGSANELPFVFFSTNEEKLYAATREVEAFLNERLRIERIGIYFGERKHNELRLSIEGSQLLGPHATKHVLSLTTEQRDAWMLGKPIELQADQLDDFGIAIEQAFYIIRHGDDFLGCGKIKNGVLLNFVPKERYVGASFTEEDEI